MHVLLRKETRGMTINFESETPIYIQIAEELEDAILSGAFPEGTQVPSTTEISVSYKINPATVLKGVTLLVDGDILYKKRGVGMFVKEGAAEKILVHRRQAFFDRYILSLLNEAEKLHIGRQELVQMIERGGAASQEQ